MSGWGGVWNQSLLTSRVLVSCPLSWAVICRISIGSTDQTFPGQGSTSHGYFHGPQKSDDLTTKSRAPWKLVQPILSSSPSVWTQVLVAYIHVAQYSDPAGVKQQFLSSRLFTAPARIDSDITAIADGEMGWNITAYESDSLSASMASYSTWRQRRDMSWTIFIWASVCARSCAGGLLVLGRGRSSSTAGGHGTITYNSEQNTHYTLQQQQLSGDEQGGVADSHREEGP